MLLIGGPKTNEFPLSECILVIGSGAILNQIQTKIDISTLSRFQSPSVVLGAVER